MLIFIDESGDAGFQFSKGSSKFFIVALIIFDDDKEAEKTALRIKEFRKSIGKTDRFEFKFNKSNREFRLNFLNAIKNSPFRVRCVIFNKELIFSKTLQNNKGKFYNYAIKTVLNHSDSSIVNAKVRIDASSDKTFKNNLTVYLRRELNRNMKVVENVKLIDSKSDVLIQLADMVVSSINRSYELNKSDNKDYINVIRKKIEDKWEFR